MANMSTNDSNGLKKATNNYQSGSSGSGRTGGNGVVHSRSMGEVSRDQYLASRNTGSPSGSSSSGSGSSFADRLKQSAINSVASQTGASTSTLESALNNTLNNMARSSSSSNPSNSSGSGDGFQRATQIYEPGSSGSGAGTVPQDQYLPNGVYNDADIRASMDAQMQELADLIDQYKAQYSEAAEQRRQAQAANDASNAAYWQTIMDQAHANAELIRASQGYRGGTDGSEYIPTPQGTNPDQWYTRYGTTNQGANGAVSLNAYDQNMLSETDQNLMLQFKADWAAAYAKGDQVGMQRANDNAETLRAKYGYSLGNNGAKFSYLQPEEGMMNNVALPAYEGVADQINDMYTQLNELNMAQLLASYNNSRAEAEYQMGKLPALYQQQRNAAAATSERERRAFREQAAASGLNVGNRSQAALSFSNNLQNTLGQLNTAEANSLAEAQHQLTQLYNSYQQQIAEAVANNNYQRAAALLQDFQLQKQSIVDTAREQFNANMQVAQFNQAARQNKAALERQEQQDQFALASELAANGSFGALGQLGGLTDAQIEAMKRNYTVTQLGQYYPILRGYLQ